MSQKSQTPQVLEAVSAFHGDTDSVPPGGTSGAAPETIAQANADQKQRPRLKSFQVDASSDRPCVLSSICIVSVNSKYLHLEARTRGLFQVPTRGATLVFCCSLSLSPGGKLLKPCRENPSMMADFTHDYFLTLSLMIEVMHAGHFLFKISYVCVRERARVWPEISLGCLSSGTSALSLSQGLSRGPGAC